MKNLLAKRIIPCLDVKDGRVVKGVNFVGLRDAGDPVELAKFYSQEGADEIVFLDITATSDNRDTIADVVRRTCREVFVPVTVGGGIRPADDIRRMLLDKANLALPDAFLKRWLFTINEGKFSLEEIEKDFDKFLEMMKWNLIQKHYVNELKLEVTPEEATQEAKALAMQQFAYYGMNQVADDMLANYAKSILENKEESRKVYEKLFERKVIDAVVPQITVTDTTVTPEEFAKLAEKAQ